MFKQRTRRTFSAVRMAIAMIPLAGCEDGVDKVKAKLDFLSVARPSQDLRQSQSERDSEALEQATSVEYRHFDIYANSRALFEGMSDLAHGRGQDGFMRDSGMLHERAAIEGAAIEDTMSSCSMRMLITQD